MVLQKKLDYGFNGYQVPRASRSARGRDCRRKKVEDSQMCSFELLAAVAGKLLLERESSHAPTNTLTAKDQHDTVEQEQQDEENPCKVEPCDQGSCGGSVFVSVRGSQDHNQNYFLKEFSHVQNVAGLGCSEKFGCAEKLVHGKTKNEFEIFPCIVEGGSSGYGGSCEGQIEDGAERNPKAEVWKVGNVPDTCNLEDPMDLDMKPSALVSSDNSVEVPLCRDHVSLDSFPRHRDEVKVVSRDDDVNFSECTQPSNITLKASRSPPPIGDRRIRMMSASKYWRVAPKLKDGELSNTDKEMKHVYHKRKICNTHQRYQRNSSSKKRKLFDQSLVSTSDEGVNSEGISNSAIKGINGDTSGTESGASSFTAGRQASIQSRDSHVKLSIKSFCVPELFIEIPETATLGSLKRTVMEAVTAILGGGLHVGVLLQGKKVRDDNKTLLQTGISKEDKLSSLGFMLEPNKTNAPSPLCSGDPSFRLHSDTIQLLTSRYSTTTNSDPGTSVASPKPSMINLGNCVESDHDSVPSPPSHISMDKTTPDSRALVAVPAMDVEALALVTFNRKSRQTELVQRRIRRPFSVSEVEALVEAVEKIGTGRWRDVKLLAFDNAKHRTYVDLKDKWKTLVHTARISPQQRRGEPVPQELLDRVLSAHAYWSHGAVTDVPSLNICKP